MRVLAAILLLLAAALPARAQGLSQALVVSSCGTPTLAVGGQVQETMDTTGRLCSHKTGSGVSPPVISVAPVASGSLTVGSTLSCTTGTWTNSPTGYAYTWLRGGSTISGATSASYVTVTADGGTSVGCSVIASNAGGNSSPSASNTLAIAAASGCVAATNYLARTTGGNEGGNAANITTLICGLVTDGVITGNLSGATGGCGTFLDALYIFAQQNQADALLNLCGTTYTATTNFPIVFTAFKGWGGVANPGLVDTNFNPATATSPKFTRNSASYGFWSYAVVSETNAAMGTSSNASVGESQIYNDYTGTFFYGRINSASGGAAPVAQPGSKGLFATERTSSSNTTLYWDGISQGNITDTSAAPNGIDFQIAAVNGASSPSVQIFSEAFISAQLGSTLHLALYNRFRTYNTAVGIP